jgi:hypothetical protein
MEEIDRNECIGNSLPKINSNFEVLDNALCQLSASYFAPLSANTLSATNIGLSGIGVYKQIVNDTLQFKKITSGSNNVSVVEDSDTVKISVTTLATISSTNVGSGSGIILKDTISTPLSLRTIVGGSNTTVTTVGDNVIISSTDPTSGTNVGTGVGKVYTTNVGNTLQFKTIKAGAGVIVTNNPNDIQIDSTGVGGGEANTASNLGTSSDGSGLFSQKSGVDLQFKRIKAGTNVTLSEAANSVTINAAGGGSGGITGGSTVGTGIGVYKDVFGTNLRFKSIAATGTNITVSEASDTLTISAPNAIVDSQNIAGASGEGSIVPATTKSGSNLQFKKIRAGSGISVTDGTTDVIISAGGFTQSLAANGWTKLPNGLLIQWGSTSNNAAPGANNAATVSFPTTFAQTFNVVVGTYTSDGNPSGVGAQRMAQVVSWTTSTFTWFSDEFVNTNPDPIGITWIALGT